MKYILVLMVALGAAGCTPPNRVAGDLAPDNQDLRAYEDRTRGVVCYRVYAYAGLSCLKMDPK